jgi:mRNA interferase MazF
MLSQQKAVVVGDSAQKSPLKHRLLALQPAKRFGLREPARITDLLTTTTASISPTPRRARISNTSSIPYLGEVTVAPVTTTVRNIPSEVFLSQAEGMPPECAVNCDHLQTISRGKLGALLTTLSVAKIEEVATAIRFALGLGLG